VWTCTCVAVCISLCGTHICVSLSYHFGAPCFLFLLLRGAWFCSLVCVCVVCVCVCVCVRACVYVGSSRWWPQTSERFRDTFLRNMEAEWETAKAATLEALGHKTGIFGIPSAAPAQTTASQGASTDAWSSPFVSDAGRTPASSADSRANNCRCLPPCVGDSALPLFQARTHTLSLSLARSLALCSRWFLCSTVL
jgi:hypothetical protein